MSKTTATVFKRLPGVLSFQRGLLVTDAEMFNEIDGKRVTLPVIRHGIRGTQNVNKAGKDTDTAGNAVRGAVSNPQVTDSAKLAPEADALLVSFGVRFMDIGNCLFACAPGKSDTTDEITGLRVSLNDFIARAKEGDGLHEVSRRYARNLLNGRWLWRNRTLAATLTVSVAVDDKPLVSVDGLAVPMNDFSDYSEAELKVAEVIYGGLCYGDVAALTVDARVTFGMKGAIEVFPSQNYLDDKPKGFARPLYCLGEPDAASPTELRVMGRAALRDQKIANALRTFDTWYPDFADHGRPIPVEPNGASLDAQVHFRPLGKNSVSAFSLAKQLNALDPNSPDGMFMIASLIRGGVYSEGAN